MCFRKKLRSEANLDADEPLEDDSEDDGQGFNFLAHKGLKIDFSKMDDFKDKI